MNITLRGQPESFRHKIRYTRFDDFLRRLSTKILHLRSWEKIQSTILIQLTLATRFSWRFPMTFSLSFEPTTFRPLCYRDLFLNDLSIACDDLHSKCGQLFRIILWQNFKCSQRRHYLQRLTVFINTRGRPINGNSLAIRARVLFFVEFQQDN